MGRTGRPRAFDTAEALRACERVFARLGYAGTSIDDLRVATGLGRGSLYAAFGDKHALFLATLDQYCRRREAEISAVLQGPDSEALGRLHDLVRYAAGSVAQNEDHVGCMASRFALELGRRDPEANARIAEDYAVMQHAILGCLHAAQRHGELDQGVDLEPVARGILALIRGLEVLAGAGQPVAELERAAEAVLAGLPLA